MKAYDEVHFSDEYILRWVREGNEYVNRITLDMMEDLQAVVQKQSTKLTKYELRNQEQIKRIEELDAENKKLRWDVSNREMDIEILKTRLVDLNWKYDIDIHEYKYSHKYVRELEDKIADLEKQIQIITQANKDSRP